VVIQSDPLNRSQLATVVCVVLTSNLRWSIAPGNVLLHASRPWTKSFFVPVSA
jgi:mRNA-degrading endonuclease toxin of MazEF toxin-antitoxin module